MRLVDEAYAEEEGAGGGAHGYSQGLFAAASCSDNPQAYDMRLEPAERERRWQEALARKQAEKPDLYAPFSIGEFLGIPPDYAYRAAVFTVAGSVETAPARSNRFRPAPISPPCRYWC